MPRRLGIIGAMPVWIDTHCHLDAPELRADTGGRCGPGPVREGVAHCVLPAVAGPTSMPCSKWRTSSGTAMPWASIRCTRRRAQDGDLAHAGRQRCAHADDARLVAVGEIGLDYFVPGLDAGAPALHFYREQLKLARRYGLPVILHVRRSADALLKGLRELPVQGGIAHAFNGSLQQAHAFLDLGSSWVLVARDL
jgi:TatD DNase family protein